MKIVKITNCADCPIDLDFCGVKEVIDFYRGKEQSDFPFTEKIHPDCSLEDYK